MVNINIIYDIQSEPLFKSAHIYAPFGKGKEDLEKEGYSIISLEQNAILRIQEGISALVSQNGNWTREGVLSVPKKGFSLTKNSPIMKYSKEATGCHLRRQDFYLTDDQVEQSLVDSIPFSNSLIPTNRFAEDETTVYAFGKTAEKYGWFLNEAGIKKMPTWASFGANIQDEPFVRQMWFRYVVDKSELDGNYRGLNYDKIVRGIKNI